MKVTNHAWLRAGRWMGLCLMELAFGLLAGAQAVSTTTVQGTVYQANGQPGSGTLNVSWPAFTTANNQAIAAGRTTVTIAPDGFMSIRLAPNLGATPAGLYYTAIYNLSDGTTSTEYWVVPAAAQASLGQVRAQLMPAAQAVQAVSKTYVDQAIKELSSTLLTVSGGTMTGPLTLSGDPTQPLHAADKHYVDSTFSLAVPLSGGNMTGELNAPAVNGVEAPAANSPQTTLQVAMNAAGADGAMEIPPTYKGTDGFTNPNGVYVRDLRQTTSQQFERSVKEFGAVCDGSTDDTNALQSALNYAQTHGVSLSIPQGTCKTRTLIWHGESIGGLGKQVSALMGYPGQDVLATLADNANLLANTRIHDLTIYVDQSADISCSPALGRAPAGGCQVNRPIESNSIFSQGGNGLLGTAGTGAGWAVGNCAIAMPAFTGVGGNGLQVAALENLEIAATGIDPMAAQYAGSHSTHTCGLYLAQWPQWSEFRNIDIRGVNTGIAIPALAGTVPGGLNADSNRWQNITIQATHGFTAATGSDNELDNVVLQACNSAASGEPPTGLVLDLGSAQQGWTIRNAIVAPVWNAVQPKLTVTAQGGAATAVSLGQEHGLGFDPYGTEIPLSFSGSCTAKATANVKSNGSIGTIAVTQGGVGCSATTTASTNVAGTWNTAAPVNLIGGQNMTFIGGNLLKGKGGYTVWNAVNSDSHGMQLGGGGGTMPGGGAYAALVANSPLGSAYQVDQFPGEDFGAKLQACLGALSAAYGGTCDARNFTGTLSMGSDLTISTANATVMLPCATISTSSQLIVTAGTRNVALRGCAHRGASTASGSQGGTVFLYSGQEAMVQVGDPTYAANTMGFHLDNVAINTTAASSNTAQALVAYRTQEIDLESLYLLGNSNQTGITLDGTGNYTGGTFLDDQLTGFQTGLSAIGHQVSNPAATDWLNASTFVRLHINCPTSGGSPIGGSYGVDLQQGDGNTFTGGDIEGCDTALHLGANAQNNTIVGLRNENSNHQVVADAGSSYNNWMTGGTMFTGQLTDNGTRNSFLDTFHRSFNGLNGDWYGSQKDATVTNHYRIGTGAGNERGLLDRYQTDYGYRWTTGLSDATAGEQYYQVLDELNNVYRLSIGQYNDGQSSTNNQTVINAAGTGAVVLNGSNNSGTGGVVIGSGGVDEQTVATISNAGNAQFNGALQVGGTTTFVGTPTVRNQANAEIDTILWAGLSASQKESLIYKDWNGNSQWYLVKDASNNWAVNSATGGLDSFKAYQSTTSGDTYINASNSTGHIRLNYESGAGAETDIYSGSSANLVAAFLGTTAIKLPGLAATTGRSCLQIDSSGYISNTGANCGTGNTNGTVTVGTSGQIAYYSGIGTALAGINAVPVTAGGTGASTATAALASLGGQAALPGITPDGANGILSAGSVTVGTSLSAPITNGEQRPSVASSVQAALAAVAKGGPVVLNPAVAYTFTSTLTISGAGQILDCNNAQITFAVSPDGPGIYIAPATGPFYNSHGAVIKNCQIAPGTQSAYAAIQDNAQSTTIENLTWLTPSNFNNATRNLPPASVGISSGTYANGGSFMGSTGQTCTLSVFNNGNLTGVATVALTGTNTIIPGTILSVDIAGYGSTSPATTAILGDGTASCSGTATVSTVIGPNNNYFFANGIEVDADQDFHLNNMKAFAHDVRCDSLYCGSGLYNPYIGLNINAAVGYINDSNFTMACQGNGIEWQNLNEFHISSVVIQAYSEFGLKVWGKGNDNRPLLSKVHFEQGNCPNPSLNMLNAGAGMIINGGKLSAQQIASSAAFPAFPASGTPGAQNYAYYVVAHTSPTSNTGGGWTNAMPVGYVSNGPTTLGGGNSIAVTIPTLPQPSAIGALTGFTVGAGDSVVFNVASVSMSPNYGPSVTISGTGSAYLDGLTGQVTAVGSNTFTATIAGATAACSACTASGLTATATPYPVTCDLLRNNQTANGRIAPYSGNAFYVVKSLNCDANALGVSFVTYADSTPDLTLAAQTYNDAWASIYVSPYVPAFNFWPGSVVLGSNGGSSSYGATQGIISGMCDLAHVISPARPGNSSLTSPSVNCIGGPSFEDYSGNSAPAPTNWTTRTNLNGLNAMMAQGYNVAGSDLNLKGAINSGASTARQGTWGPTDLWTLQDSNFQKTMATPGSRPLADTADTAIGVDRATGGGFAARDANSISLYINGLFDGAAYLERLTATGKTFKVPVTITGLNVEGIVTNTSGGMLGTESTITAAQCPAATSGTQGCVKPDNSTITISGGVISAVGGGGGSFVISATPLSDLVCAHGSDTTVGSLAISVGGIVAGTPPSYTFNTAAGVNNFYFVGQTLQTQGVTGTGNFNVVDWVVTAITSNTVFTATSATATGTGASTASSGTVSLICNNSTDATGLTAFATSLTLPQPSGFSQYRVMSQYQLFTPATAPNITIPLLYYNNNGVTASPGSVGTKASAGGIYGSVAHGLTFRSTGNPGYIIGTQDSQSVGNAYSYSIAGSLSATTLSGQALTLKTLWAASGLGGTLALMYSSGGTSCTNGTQVVNTFNGAGTGGAGTITVSGGIPTGSVTFKSPGYGYTSIPTTGQVATCTGLTTFTNTGALGGAQGAALRMVSFTARQ